MFQYGKEKVKTLHRSDQFVIGREDCPLDDPEKCRRAVAMLGAFDQLIYMEIEELLAWSEKRGIEPGVTLHLKPLHQGERKIATEVSAEFERHLTEIVMQHRIGWKLIEVVVMGSSNIMLRYCHVASGNICSVMLLGKLEGKHGLMRYLYRMRFSVNGYDGHEPLCCTVISRLVDGGAAQLVQMKSENC